MVALSQTWNVLLSPLAGFVHYVFANLLAPEERRYWLWLPGTLLAIDLLYRFGSRPRSESFWSYSAPWRIYAHPSAILDYKFLFVQKLVSASIIAPMLVSAIALGMWISKILGSLLGPGPGWRAGMATLVVFAVIRLVLFDIGHYVSHYIQHKVPFFWEFHKVHHAAEVLTPVTALRKHPVEDLLDSFFQGPLQALGLGVFYYLYGSQQSLLAFVGGNAIIVLYYVTDSLRHTHAWVSFGPVLEHVIASPAQHQIHHSRTSKHLDTNLAQYFSFLDWMAGTLYVPKGMETLDFGLHEGADPELTTVWSLYWIPLKRAVRLLGRSNASGPAPSPAPESVAQIG
ncbi:MAG TPA: sterol desaturase family protein [Bryobacteraceae bacterium]|nr:sterol desaturase family protein [Bryobacteraceae bacterium]